MSHSWVSRLRTTFLSQNTFSALPIVPTAAGPKNRLTESQRTRDGESLSPLFGLKFTGYGSLGFLTCEMRKQGTSSCISGGHSKLADKQYSVQTSFEPPVGCGYCWHHPYPVKTRRWKSSFLSGCREGEGLRGGGSFRVLPLPWHLRFCFNRCHNF